MSTEHFFFALSLPESTKEELARQCDKIQKELPFKRWVHQADYHITLAFIGAANTAIRAKAIEYIREALLDIQAFSLHIDTLGSFGSRILWAGVKESSPLMELQQIVYNQCIKAGFILEKRAYTPHITLARKWAGKESFHAEHLPKLEKTIPFTAIKVVLYQTHMDRVPKYENKDFFILTD